MADQMALPGRRNSLFHRWAHPRREPRHAKSYWREYVLAQSEYLRDRTLELAALSEPASNHLKGRIVEQLEGARHCAGDHFLSRPYRPRRAMDIWTGAAVEGAFLRLHAAEALLVDLMSSREIGIRASALIRELERSRPTDPRLLGAQDELRHVQRLGGNLRPARRRAAYRQALQAKHAVLDEQHVRIRSFRNAVIIATAALAVITVAFAVIGILRPGDISLCFQPEKGDVCPTGTAPSSADIPVVLFLGMAGGALAVAVAIRSIRGTSTPYAVPLALAALKLPAGALTSGLGLLLLKGEFIPGFTALDTQGQILAYAVVLGYAQQLATRLVDQQAHDVLDRVPSTAPRVRADERSGLDGSAVPAQASAGADSAVPSGGVRT
jgi:hypothetical protein